MMKRAFQVLAAIWTLLALPAGAQSPVVVELFTSQGCSSCPPADKLLHELAKRDDVIALALHVDYWDYIGWKDEFADPAFSERQRAYAMEAGRRSIYTPQMIVNGVDAIVGARPMELVETIQRAASAPASVQLSLSRTGNDIRIVGEKMGESSREPLVIYMLRYSDEREAQITRGENAGHTLRYANVTEDWQILAEWDTAVRLDITAEVRGEKPVVVLAQRGRAGPILAAAEIR